MIVDQMQDIPSQEFEETYRVLLVASEVLPFAKTGGLADVAGSLPKALATLGNDARVVLPRYRGINGVKTIADFPVWVGDRKETAIVRQSSIKARLGNIEKEVPVYFIDNYHYFDRDGLYGYPDEAERYAFFSKAVLEMLKRIDFEPDILHCNDWQTGPMPLLLRASYARDPFYSRMATVFTIHNLQYQGNFPRWTLRLLGLGDEYFTPDGIEFYGQVSFMKAGLMYADVLNTVSRTYAEEIKTPALGYGMDGILRSRAQDLFGIVNGINYHEFNPETDPRIYKNYNLEKAEYKRENKRELQKEMGLSETTSPLIGMVTRLVDQKGLDLIANIADELLKEDLQLVVLGTGDPYYEDLFRSLHDKYPGRVGVYIGFNAVLAQRIYAGADMFLMPSRFEPCGLGQLIALRYGTIPIVRATGGLKDTVSDYDAARGTGNGFTFSDYQPQALLATIRRALEIHERPDHWQRLVRSALSSDFSWNKSAVEYMGLYAAAKEKKRPAVAAV